VTCRVRIIAALVDRGVDLGVVVVTAIRVDSPRRFCPVRTGLSARRTQRIASASAGELDVLAARVLSAATLDEIWAD